MALPHFRPRPIGQGRSGLVGRLQEALPLLSSPSIPQVVAKQLSVEIVDVDDGELLVARFSSIQIDDDVSVVMTPSPWSCIGPALSTEPVLGDIDWPLGLLGRPHGP